MNRRTPLILIAVLLFAAPARGAQQTLFEAMSNDAALHDVAFVDAQHGWAVGDRGVILHTIDGGQRWRRQASGVDCPLYSVWFVDSQRGWAVGGVTTPYTHSTRGVVLQTQDGGFSWVRLSDKVLPLLRGVRFFGARRGVAWGEPNPISPAGMFVTNDGGAHWAPAPSEGSHSWTTAAFASPEQGALAGPRGLAASASGLLVNNIHKAYPERQTARSMSLSRDGRGWLVGDSGLLLTTDSAGHRWSPPQTRPPLTALGLAEWRSVASRGDRLWVVGSPGSVVLASDDAGKTWTLQRTGQSTPLAAVTFVNDRRGWAVGALGTILSTVDGGQNWRSQRQGGSRLAALVIAPTIEDMPLELITKISAAEGYLTGGAVVMPNLNNTNLQHERLTEALSVCGASYAETLWAFPRSNSQRAAIERAGVSGLESRLKVLIAQARPEAVFFAESRHAHINRTVQDALLKAVAGTTPGSAGLDLAGLTPWQPKRVLRISRSDRGSFSGLSADDFDSQIGTSLEQWTLPLRGLIDEQPRLTPTRVTWTPIAGASVAGGRLEPMAGLLIHRGGPARRPHATPPGSKLAALRASALKQDAFQQLLAADVGGSDWANRAVQLMGGLDANTGADRLLRLAWAYEESGKARLSADAWYLLARRYADHPLAEHALRRLILHYSSSEAAHDMLRSARRNGRQDALANIAPDFRPDGEEEDWSRVPKLDEHQRRAIKLGEYLESAQPLLHAQPPVRFCLAAALRRQGKEDYAAELTTTLSRPSTPAEWRRCSQAEEWLRGRRGPSPVNAVTAQATTTRPKLDGILNDDCWRLSQPAALQDPSAAGAEVRVAFDNKFLYLAVRASKLEGAAYPVDAAPRPRDADLTGYDRVSLRLDLDRDYQTAFDLTVDCRGYTHDHRSGDASWNPAWYVAAKQGEQAWAIEAAVPLKELTNSPPTSADAWAISIDRVAPGRPQQSWTGSPSANGSPAAFGLLLFEREGASKPPTPTSGPEV